MIINGSFVFIIITTFFANICESKWSPVGNQIKTKWAATVDPAKVWPEYPRPQLVRNNWINLNGLWEYSITPIGSAEPTKQDGEILVPFPVESSLSGVGKAFFENQALWYRKYFTSPAIGPNELLILNFGAVDYHCWLSINGHLVGEHKGGFDSFSFDITKFLDHSKKEQLIVLKVLDATSGPQPRGKQVLAKQPHNFAFYTAVSGIWRPVFLEKVPKEYVQSLKIVPDIDANSVHITINTNNPNDHSNDAVIEIHDKTGKVVSHIDKALVNTPNKITIPNPNLWSNTDPYLYDLKIKLRDDSITSYFGLRKVEVKKDGKGINRIFLNHKPIFMFGALDQGYWPDGIYVPPNEEAMKYDIEMEQKLGFNTARKHMKVESDRWYYLADKMGLLVWQDFPSAFDGLIKGTPDNRRPKPDSDQIELEMERMVTQLYNHPSIVMWVVFNEDWGQYDTNRIGAMFKRWDPTRIINEVSGFTDHKGGDVHDYHTYPIPKNPEPNEPNRAIVLGEFGGVTGCVKEHSWKVCTDTVNTHNWQNMYMNFLGIIKAQAVSGLSAAIYTQITDVETEDTGILSYDRKFEKFMNISAIKRFSETLSP